jgi:hypothetical protein
MGEVSQAEVSRKTDKQMWRSCKSVMFVGSGQEEVTVKRLLYKFEQEFCVVAGVGPFKAQRRNGMNGKEQIVTCS